MNLLVDGGRPIGVQDEGTDYPLLEPSADIAGLLADFYLSHSVTDLTLPLHLERVHDLCRPGGACQSLPSDEGSTGSSSSSSAAFGPFVVVADAHGRTVFDGRLAAYFRERAWGRFQLFEWHTQTAVCRALVHRGWQEATEPHVYDVDFRPVRAVLDERTHDILPGRVEQLGRTGQLLTGAVQLRNGFNTTLTPTTRRNTTQRAVTRVVLAAEPGSGAGRYDNCSETEPLVRRINGVGPDARGRFLLETLDCYRLERPQSSLGAPDDAPVTPAALQLRNNCLPCCECRDFETTYQGIRRLYFRYKDLGTEMGRIRDTFLDNRTRWLAERECRHQQMVRLHGVALRDGGTTIVATVCNHSRHCRYQLQLDLRFQHSRGLRPRFDRDVVWITDPGGVLMPVRLDARVHGSWPNLRFGWERLDGQIGHKVVLRLLFADPFSGDHLQVDAFPFLGGAAYPSDRLDLSFL